MTPKQNKGSGRKASRTQQRSPLEGVIRERLESLIGELSSLRYEEDQERFDDIVAELVNFGPRLQPRLLALASSISYQERRAAVEAIGQLDIPQRQSILLERLEDANWKVRRSAALAIAQSPTEEAMELLIELIEDPHRELRLAALEALGRLGNKDATDALEQALGDGDWRIRQESAIALGRVGAPRSMVPLVSALLDDDEDVQQATADALVVLLEHVEEDTLQQHIASREDKDRRALLQALQKGNLKDKLPRVVEALTHLVSVQVDVNEISQFGRVLTSPDQARLLDRAFERQQEVDDLLRSLRQEGNSSVILIGEAGVGKTAIIHELTHRLIEEDPTCAVLETSTPELMVGTKYIGEWETKLHDLVEKIKAPRRVYLYLTNVNDLPGAGTTSSNKQNFVTLLAPYMRRGDITVIGESTAEGLRTGIDKDLSIKRLFRNIPVKVPDAPTILKVVRQSLAELGRRREVTLEAANEVLELLVELSGTYYSTMAQPGRSVTVLRQVVDHIIEQRGESGDVLRVEPEDVIKGLARFTGLPELLLNDELPLNTDEVRAFFDRRVLGQPEAVEAVVDLITLIKAGLTDPTKPFGVFLFVGPTGVGKTELAKALSEFIFGSDKRLLRFDLSEYRDYDSFEKLIGGTWRHRESGRLTSKVREQPFSVILLDEIEKAHPNIFDLFLQVFDDGRLTDAQGRTTDFRHSIIIMTSNLASAFTPGGPPGFGADEDNSLASRKGILREVHRFFRPEFLNRIDRLVVFKALEHEIMRRIARRELGKVLTRSGLLRRRLVVDMEPSILDFLMARGFSKAFGARPLKRAVETQVLLPLAREIVSRGPGYGGDILKVRAEGDAGDPSPRSSDAAYGPGESPSRDTRRVVVEQESSSLEARRQQLNAEGLDALSGSPLAPLTKAPRTRKQARAQLRAGGAQLAKLLGENPVESLRRDVKEAESQMTEVTFWDDPDQAQRRLVRKARQQYALEALEKLIARREALQRALEQKLRLRDWHAQLTEWLMELHLTEALLEPLSREEEA